MKTTEMASGGMIYLQCFMIIGLVIQVILRLILEQLLDTAVLGEIYELCC
jgi:hypothetical protein